MAYKGNQITWGRLATSLKATITNTLNAITNHESVKASTTTLGHIKADGTTITVDPTTGVASALGGKIIDYSTGHLDALTETGVYASVGTHNTDRGFPSVLTGTAFIEVWKDKAGTVYQKLYNVGTTGTLDLIYIRVKGSSSAWTVWSQLPNGITNALNNASGSWAASASAVKQVNDTIQQVNGKFTLQQTDAVLGQGWITNTSPEAHPLMYFKDAFGIVHMYGNVKKVENLSLVTTMPEGFRPVRTREFMAQYGASGFKPLFIFADGKVQSYYNDVDTNVIINVSYPTF